MRTERDFLGVRELPEDVYYGVETLRALENFTVSGIRARPELIHAYMQVKKAAALTNMELGVLDRVRGEAILKAAEEILKGRQADQFPVDVFQAGAGTSLHMNVNEVLANRALELLGRRKGEYGFLSPHDHVNRSQSTNDTFPTAAHLALIRAIDRLIPALDSLAATMESKGEEFVRIPKSGRTHLMDALPVMLGDEFRAYATVIRRSRAEIQERRRDLLEVPLGGTATGTGATTPPGYRDRVLSHLSTLVALPVQPARNSHEALQSRSRMASLSGALRGLSLELVRISSDLRLMGSGPVSGFGEISLPAVQPGSSIMPGKVNPVMPECLTMICFQVLGNDTAVAYGVQAGQLELNVMTPLLTHNLLESIRYLSNFLPAFETRCIRGITAQEAHLRNVLEKNPSLATLLASRIGYLEAAEIAEEALRTGAGIPHLVVQKGLMTEEEANAFFDLTDIARGQL